jgi:uncharacterized protein CbrC (UPF0167 family)
MPDPLPVFLYHPDPIATGSIEPSTTPCKVCGQARGYIYAGPVYTAHEEDLDDAICPWCIADGSAHERFAAEFTDPASIGGDDWDEVADAVIEAVAWRTPGFNAWQQERWFTHCADAAAFLGPMGYKQVARLGPALVKALQDEAGLEGADWKEYYRGLEKDGSPTAYVFRCLHCGTLGGYSDFD